MFALSVLMDALEDPKGSYLMYCSSKTSSSSRQDVVTQSPVGGGNDAGGPGLSCIPGPGLAPTFPRKLVPGATLVLLTSLPSSPPSRDGLLWS